MKKLNLYLLLCLLFVGYRFTIAQSCVSQSAPLPQIGAMPQPQYSNLWKQSSARDKHGRLFGSGNGALWLGDDGWPIDINPTTKQKQLHGVRFYPGEIQPLLKNGDELQVRFKGPTSAVANDGNDACSWNSIQANTPSAGYTTAKVRLNSPQSGNGFQFSFYGHIEEIQIMRPGYAFDDYRYVTDEYVTHTKHWKCFRFMGLMGGYANQDQTWGKRLSKNATAVVNKYNWGAEDANGRFDEDNTGTNASGYQRGLSWEDQIDLCNYLNIDMWINVPTMADDDYILNLAKLIKDRLKPTLNVNVEIGNEIWNTGPPFQSFGMHMQMMVDEFKGTIGYGSTADKRKILGGANCPGCNIPADNGNIAQANGFGAFEAMQRWQARRLKEYADQFATVFGWRDEGGDVGNRIRLVLCGQIGYGDDGMAWNIAPGLDFLRKAYGNDAPRKYLYAVAITSYTTPHGLPLSASAQQIVDAEKKNVDEAYAEFSVNPDRGGLMGNLLEGVFGRARMFGLKMYAYEAGNEIAGANWTPFNNISEYARLPQSGTNTTLNLNKWFSWFGYDALYIKNGDFLAEGGKFTGYGISFNLNELTPIRKAYIDFAALPAPALSKERGNVIGATAITTLDARKVAAYPTNWAAGNFGIPTIGYGVELNSDYTVKGDNRFERPFIIRCDKSGKYTFEVERQIKNSKTEDDATPVFCDIYLNEKLVHNAVNLSAGTFSRNIKFNIDGYERVFWWTKKVQIDIPYGTHVLRVVPSTPSPARAGTQGKFNSNIDLMAYRFTLDQALPPAQPKEILGDLVVCKGNNKARYEIGENDPSVCEYEWTGVPAGATILAKEIVAGTSPQRSLSGQGTYKIYIDWGNVAPGSYTMSVVGKNQDAANAWQSSVARTFKVTVGKCGFDVAPNPVCLNQKTKFTPEPMEAVEYFWDNGKFGEPNANRYTLNTSNTPLEVTYTKEGQYSVSLKTKNAAGIEKPYFNTITVTTCNAPSVVALSYCQGQTGVPAVTATLTNSGTNLKWYTVPTGGTALPNAPTPTTNTAGVQTFYVSQMNGGIESERSKLEVTINKAPEPPAVTAPNRVVYCKDAVSNVTDLTNKVSASSTTNTLKWYTTIDGTISTGSPTKPITSAEGSTTLYISQALGTCESATRSSIIIEVTPPLAAPTVTGVIANKCINTPVLPTEYTSLVTAGTGKTLQWHSSETAIGTATPPTINTTTIGKKSVWVSQKEGQCQSALAEIAFNVTEGPTKYTVGGGGATDCKTGLAQAITLSKSDNGVTYVLMLGSLPKDTIVANGSALSFTPQTEVGNYTVVATSGGTCKSTMTGQAVLTNTLAPIQKTLSGGGAIECGTTTGKTLSLSASENTVTYYLLKDGKDTVATKVGNGNTLDFTGLQNPGNYSVRASKGGCETSMTDGEILTSPNPVKVFDVSSTGNLDCVGSGSITLALSGSESDVVYTLYKDGVATTPTQTGSGSQPINFTNIKLGGTYTIKAANTTTKCVADMSGNKVVEVPQTPVAQTISGGGSYCEGQTAPMIKISGSEVGVTYTLKTGSGFNTTVRDTKVASTTAGFDFAPQTENGAYTVTASKGTGAAACTKEMTGNAILEKLPPSVGGSATAAQPRLAKGGNTDISITGQTGTITWQTSTDNVNYTDVVPTNNNPMFNTGALPSEGIYYYRAKIKSGTCTEAFSTPAIVTVITVNTAGIASVSPSAVCKGSTAMLKLVDYTGAIQWESSTDGTNFTNIANGTNADQATAAIDVPTSFRAKVGSNYSNVVNVTVTNPPAKATLTGPANATATCEDNVTGYTLTLAPVESNADYTLYKDDQVQSAFTLVNGKFSGLKQAGVYTVKANLIESPTCISDMTETFTIAPAIYPTKFTVSGGGSACANAVGGNANIVLSGSQIGVIYALSDQTTSLLGTGAILTFSKTLTSANAGTYSVIALDTLTQCQSAMNEVAEITIRTGVGTPTLVGESTYCNKGSNGIAVVVDNATSKVWSLSPPSAGAIDQTGNVTWNDTYTGKAIIKIVVSNEDCGTETKEDTLTTTLTATPQSSPIMGDSLVCRGNIVIYSVKPQAGITYNWTINANTTVEKDDSKGIITVTYMEDLSKEGATLSVTPTSIGCGPGQVQSKQINKDNGCDLFVPNILTPNTADNNSVWKLEGVENYPKMSIQIFNRWGAEVHSHSGKYDKPWDGTTGGNPLPTATYYYVIDKNDGTSKITGSVTVVRE